MLLTLLNFKLMLMLIVILIHATVHHHDLSITMSVTTRLIINVMKIIY